uniref:CHRD domain-containing protein n=1 Tax=Thermogemmatispora argillosa TaxID=2045280 RepID=A0A455T2R2_9CHLR|nr:hypothetical protein KTA_24070 [Thermogemmatispora argillosa]
MLKRLAVALFLVLIIVAIFGPNLADFAKGLLGSVGKPLTSAISLPSSNIQAHLVHTPSQTDSAASSPSHLQIAVQGLKPTTTYYLTIDEGACGGPTLLLVGSLKTDEAGTALKDFSLDLSDPASLASRKLWLNFHSGSFSGVSSACSLIDTSLLR